MGSEADWEMATNALKDALEAREWNTRSIPATALFTVQD
jgi:hypothetical protein